MTEPQKPKGHKNFKVVLLLLARRVRRRRKPKSCTACIPSALGRPKEQAQPVQTSEAQLKQLLEERRGAGKPVKTLKKSGATFTFNVAECSTKG